MVLTVSRLLLILAVVLEAIILVAGVASLALPRVEAWQAAALLSFFASFLVP